MIKIGGKFWVGDKENAFLELGGQIRTKELKGRAIYYYKIFLTINPACQSFFRNQVMSKSVTIVGTQKVKSFIFFAAENR